MWTLGAHYAAPQTLLDSQGRRLAWGWIREGRTREAQVKAGWSGLLSLPRVLGLDANGRLTSEPVPELRALRGAHHAVGAIALAHDSLHEIQGVAGAQLEILAEFTPAPNGTVGLAVRRSPDGAEETRIEYNFADDRLDDRLSSSHPSICRPIAPTAAGRCIGRRTRPYACTCSSTLRLSRCLRTDGLRPAASTRRGPTAWGCGSSVARHARARPSASLANRA